MADDLLKDPNNSYCAITVAWSLAKQSLGSVHVSPEKFENAALFLRFSLPSTLIYHENGAFRKRSSSRSNLKTLAFLCRVDEKHFENRALRKR